MLKITPIQNKKYGEFKSTSHPRPVFTQKQDAFERTNISFKGGVDLHLPVREIEELFERTYQALVKEPDVAKQCKQTTECFDELIRLRTKRAGGSFHIDRDHEIVNQMNDLVDYNNDLILGKVPNNQFYYSLFKRSAANVMAVVRRYEFFLEKGLDKNTMSPKDVFGMACEYAREYAKGKDVKLVVEGEDVLSKHKDGIISYFGHQFEDYNLYIISSNLMQNGVKYTRQGSTVNVKFAEQAIGKEKYLTIAVRDEGIGIRTKEDWENALKGNRAQNAIDAGIQGTGHGIRRVARILEKTYWQNKTLERNFPLNPGNIQYPGTEITAFLRLKD